MDVKWIFVENFTLSSIHFASKYLTVNVYPRYNR